MSDALVISFQLGSFGGWFLTNPLGMSLDLTNNIGCGLSPTININNNNKNVLVVIHNCVCCLKMWNNQKQKQKKTAMFKY